MYASFFIKNPFFVQTLFPTLLLTPEVEQRIKNITFFGVELKTGFRSRKMLFLKKLKENNIIISETGHHGDEIIFGDEHAKAAEELFG